MPPRSLDIPAGSGGGPPIPPAAWRRRLDQARSTWPGRPVGLKLSILLGLLPVVVRTARGVIRDLLRQSETTVWTHGIRARPIMGVPLGGLGEGTITRGWRGHLARWQMRPGVYQWRTVAADQFSLWVRREGLANGEGPTAGQATGPATGPGATKRIQPPPAALVLSPKPVAARRRDRPAAETVSPRALAATGLDAWNWSLDEARATYYALFPRAWTVYEDPVAVPGLRLTCREGRPLPVIPHNYKSRATRSGFTSGRRRTPGPTWRTWP